MEYTKEILENLETAGGVNYPLRKIINALGIKADDVHQFTCDFYNTNHDVCKAFERGRDKSDFDMDAKLLEMAKAGDMDARKQLELRKLKNAEE